MVTPDGTKLLYPKQGGMGSGYSPGAAGLSAGDVRGADVPELGAAPVGGVGGRGGEEAVGEGRWVQGDPFGANPAGKLKARSLAGARRRRPHEVRGDAGPPRQPAYSRTHVPTPPPYTSRHLTKPFPTYPPTHLHHLPTATRSRRFKHTLRRARHGRPPPAPLKSS